jgi:hypothetical protein
VYKLVLKVLSSEATATAAGTFVLVSVSCCSRAFVQFYGFVGRNLLVLVYGRFSCVPFAPSDAPCLAVGHRVCS